MKDARPVVLYSEESCNALVLLLDGEGPKFYRGRSVHIDADTGKETVGGEWKYEKARYRIIADGKRFDLILAIRQARAEFERQKQQHDRAFRQAEHEAMWTWREKWIAENPYPRWPGVEEVLK